MEVKITTDCMKGNDSWFLVLVWRRRNSTASEPFRWNLIQVHGPIWSNHECKGAPEVAQSIREGMASLFLLSVAKS